MAKIEWIEGAVRDLGKLDRQIAQRILRKVDWFSKNFPLVVPEPLTGELKGTYKLRVGDWRIIYTVKVDAMIIQSIDHRREIYKIP